MSKVSRRASAEDINKQIRERKQAQKVLRQSQKAEGLMPSAHSTTPNSKCQYKSKEEERDARVDAVTEQARVFRTQLPVLLNRLGKIPDPRNPKKVRHKLTVLMIYGILIFVFQMASRREANRQMSHPVFMENLRYLFPELESLPHHDTLNRILCEIEVDKVEEVHIGLLRRFIRNKKFKRYLIDRCYPIAVDGTQKFSRDWLWSKECLQRTINSKDEDEDKDKDEDKRQYYVYVLEANLVFYNGMSIPLMSEFLSYTVGDTDTDRQDCERKAFVRLAAKLKREFPRLPIMVLLDGLYPNGPIMELCCKNHWDYMMVLQDKSLRSVWEEFEGLKKLETENHLKRTWANRRQHFQWINGIQYYYGRNERKRQIVHLVLCDESWEEVATDTAEIITKRSRHAWISRKPLNRRNLHKRCNLCARHRWGIESGILVEKCHGYNYEHCFSYNWNAMKGYHYLMRLGHMLNILAQYCERLVKMFGEMGTRGFIRFIRETLSGPWFDDLCVKERLCAPFQLRLI